MESAGILLRDPITKEGLISCQFPVDDDITNQMIWIPIDERPVEAIPIYTREAGIDRRIKNARKRPKEKMNEENFYVIEEGNFRLRVHD